MTATQTAPSETKTRWEVWLPFETPLSLNDRMGHWAKAKAVATWREGTGWALRPHHIPHCTLIEVRLTYFPKVDRRRDPDNLVATLKPVVDALVDAGIVDDDTQDYVHRNWPWVAAKLPVAPQGRFVLEVEKLE